MKLLPGVRARLKRKDPMDPDALTLTDMRKMPFKLWMRYIEPRIVVMGKNDGDCWCWDVGHRNYQIEKWVPQLVASHNPDDEYPITRRWNVRHFIMSMFYDYPEEYVVYRDREICTQHTCVRPSHMIVAPRGYKP